MATTAAAPAYTHAGDKSTSGIWSWITTVDHKRIGMLYLYSAFFFFILGGLEAILIRMQLQGPNGQLLTAEQYNQIFTMHGTTMVFLVVMPLSAAFFNFLIPLQIGARDVAFPRMNAFSFWVFLFGGIFINASWFVGAAPDAGWFGYAPLTTMQFSPGLNQDFWVIGLQILGASSLIASFNFITTIINMRAPGMTMMRMPLFTWNSFVVQFLILLSFPVITIALVFLQLDRFYGTNFYTISAGGDPLLWQHLFWIFGHPEVYILILPAFGLISEVIPTFSRKPIFGYPVMVYATILIGFLGFGVWAHHMFAVGMGPIADTVFGLTTMLIAIPTGVKIFNWTFTMWGGSVRFTTAMKFAVGLVALFTIGGISGVMHASPPADLQQTDTYFIVAHFHYVLVGGALMGIFAGVYYYYPKMTGRMLSEKLGNLHFWLWFVGVNLTFMPMHWSGLAGMSRRIYQYDALQGYELYNQLASYGSYIQAIAVIVFFVNMFWSRARGAVAPADPWGAPTLEWAMPSPPPDYNFAKIPQVTSRYPVWDMKAPELTADVPHSHEGDKRIEVDLGGREVGSVEVPDGRNRQAPEAPMHLEGRLPTAHELGIPMPNPSAMPIVVALFMVLMFACMIFYHTGHPRLATGGMIASTIVMALALYNWFLTPLEDHH